jgi:hypothetical protein
MSFDKKYYHLATEISNPKLACGFGDKYTGWHSWDWWNVWSKKKTSSQGFPRCPACLESEYYALCLLGELP